MNAVTYEDSTEHSGSDRLAELDLIAGNANTSAEILKSVFIESMQICPMYNLIEKLAVNPKADLELLELLADDESPIVRGIVAKNPKAISLMWKLAKDRSAYVRYEIAKTSHFPDHLYQSLVHDDDPRVSRRAIRTLRRLKEHESLFGTIIDLFSEIGRRKAG
jgi:hypothetical protein